MDSLMFTKNCKIDYLSESDFNEASCLFTNNKVRQYLGGAISQHDALEKLDAWFRSNASMYFVIRLNDNTFCGIISISPYEKDKNEISYQFLPQFWGKGIAYETLLPVLDFSKIEFGYSEIYAETQSKNLRSCKLLERIGFRYNYSLIRFDEKQCVYSIKI